jgi:hypothetical protein
VNWRIRKSSSFHEHTTMVNEIDGKWKAIENVLCTYLVNLSYFLLQEFKTTPQRANATLSCHSRKRSTPSSCCLLWLLIWRWKLHIFCFTKMHIEEILMAHIFQLPFLIFSQVNFIPSHHIPGTRTKACWAYSKSSTTYYTSPSLVRDVCDEMWKNEIYFLYIIMESIRPYHHIVAPCVEEMKEEKPQT